MALTLSNTVDRTLERLRNAFIDTARGAREVVGVPIRADLPDDDVPRLRGRIDACLEGKGGETARRARAAELGQVYLSLSPTGRKKFLLTLANEYGLPREAAMAAVEKWRASKEPARALRRALEPPARHAPSAIPDISARTRDAGNATGSVRCSFRPSPCSNRMKEDLWRSGKVSNSRGMTTRIGCDFLRRGPNSIGGIF